MHCATHNKASSGPCGQLETHRASFWHKRKLCTQANEQLSAWRRILTLIAATSYTKYYVRIMRASCFHMRDIMRNIMYRTVLLRATLCAVATLVQTMCGSCMPGVVYARHYARHYARAANIMCEFFVLRSTLPACLRPCPPAYALDRLPTPVQQPHLRPHTSWHG